MTVSVAATWQTGYAVSAGFFFPYPAARPVQLAVTNTPGDWLFAIVTWRQEQAGEGISVCVADDAHNWWEPVGSPATDSPAAGVTRTAVWCAPAARVANTSSGVTNIQVAPTGTYLALTVVIADVSGLAPWMQATAVTGNYVNAGTSLSLSAAAPSAQALLFAAAAGDSNNLSLSGPGAGWTALPAVAVSNGSDHTADLDMLSGWQVTSGSSSAAWTAGGGMDLSGVIAGVLVSAPAPSQPSPYWPVVITEIAPGSGAQTPPSQLTWTALSARKLATSVTQGRQYTLSQLQAGQGTMTIDNPDGALIPPGTGAFAGTDSGTPVRQRVIWQGGAWQVQFSGNGTAAAPQIDTGQIFTVTPGVTYDVSAWLGTSVPYSSGVSITIVWRTSGGGLISTVSSPSVTGPAAALVTVSGTAPGTAAKANVVIGAGGTPASGVVFYAAAAPPVTTGGWLTVPPGVSWTAENGASVTTLAQWQPDGRGAPNLSPSYIAFNGFFKRWPWAMEPDLYRGKTDAEITDIWGYANGILNSMAIEECLLDSPTHLWPMTDPAGSTSASNLAPGNANPLTLVLSKYGAGGAAVTWGANSGALIAASSAKITASGKSGGGTGMYSQVLTGTSLNTDGYGYALVCQDSGFPAISGGVTIECWWSGQTNTSGYTGFTAATSGSLFTASPSAGNYANGTPVVLVVAAGFTLPGGFSAGTVYYVISASGSSFQLSASVGGSAITVTSSGAGFILITTPWEAIIFSARNAAGPVVQVSINVSTGALQMRYKPAGATGTTIAVIDSSNDYREFTELLHMSLAFSRTTWRALVNGGNVASASGTFTSQLPSAFNELCFGGVQDRGAQGGAFTGYLAFGAVYPLQLARVRVITHQAANTGLASDAACDRVERVLEYAGIAGRRWLGQQNITYFGDLTVSGQDIGGHAAASSAGNIAASTAPALLYIAPTGDIFYHSKLYTWNQPVKWVLGDSTGAGEIPFLPQQFATDYDPARVVNDIQVTQLDTQTVTVPSGIMASTTMAAVEAASEAQYGDLPYQQTGYLTYDWSSAYNAGGSLVDLSNWLASVYAKPQNRVQSISVNAAAHPSAWPFWAGASAGDMVQVNVRPPTAATSPLISLIARITQTQRQLQFSQDGTSGTITCVLDFAPEYNALICDDPVRGLLNGTNVLSW